MVQLEDTRLRAERAERRIQQFTQEVDFKNRELETVRCVCVCVDV